MGITHPSSAARSTHVAGSSLSRNFISPTPILAPVKHPRHQHQRLPHLIKTNVATFTEPHNERAQAGVGDGAAGEGVGGEVGEGGGDRRQHLVRRRRVLLTQEGVEAVEVGEGAGGQRNFVGVGHGAAGLLARVADQVRRVSRVWPRASLSNAARRASAMRSSASGMIGSPLFGLGAALFIAEG